MKLHTHLQRFPNSIFHIYFASPITHHLTHSHVCRVTNSPPSNIGSNIYLTLIPTFLTLGHTSTFAYTHTRFSSSVSPSDAYLTSPFSHQCVHTFSAIQSPRISSVWTALLFRYPKVPPYLSESFLLPEFIIHCNSVTLISATWVLLICHYRRYS